MSESNEIGCYRYTSGFVTRRRKTISPPIPCKPGLTTSVNRTRSEYRSAKIFIETKQRELSIQSDSKTMSFARRSFSRNPSPGAIELKEREISPPPTWIEFLCSTTPVKLIANSISVSISLINSIGRGFIEAFSRSCLFYAFTNPVIFVDVNFLLFFLAMSEWRFIFSRHPCKNTEGTKVFYF